jgi:hypothetical protein
MDTVYFIEGEESRRIKIGFTAGRAEDRLRALQTGSPERLKLVATLPGSKLLEGQLHDRFAEDRCGGEWFRRSAALSGFIYGVEVSRTQWRLWRETKKANAAPRDPVPAPEREILSPTALADAADQILAAVAGAEGDPFGPPPPPRRRPL